jgi:hypothetical protein
VEHDVRGNLADQQFRHVRYMRQLQEIAKVANQTPAQPDGVWDGGDLELTVRVVGAVLSGPETLADGPVADGRGRQTLPRAERALGPATSSNRFTDGNKSPVPALALKSTAWALACLARSVGVDGFWFPALGVSLTDRRTTLRTLTFHVCRLSHLQLPYIPVLYQAPPRRVIGRPTASSGPGQNCNSATFMARINVNSVWAGLPSSAARKTRPSPQGKLSPRPTTNSA